MQFIARFFAVGKVVSMTGGLVQLRKTSISEAMKASTALSLSLLYQPRIIEAMPQLDRPASWSFTSWRRVATPGCRKCRAVAVGVERERERVAGGGRRGRRVGEQSSYGK
jgi:hypothetical protein